MKPPIAAAIVICALVLVSTAAYTATIPGEQAIDREIDGVGLLIDTPRTPVGSIYGSSSALA